VRNGDGESVRRIWLILVAMASTVASVGCMSVPTVPASSEIVQIAVNRERPPPDRARVFIATGRQPMFFDGSGPMTRHFDPADIYVNNTRIGSVNRGEVMVFDVVPGSYTFAWFIANVKPGPGKATMRPGVFELSGGKITSLSADHVYTTYYLAEGLVPALIDKDGRRLAPDVKVVRPALCPPTLCL
jgi:hypothetical protein